MLKVGLFGIVGWLLSAAEHLLLLIVWLYITVITGVVVSLPLPKFNTKIVMSKIL